MLSKPLLTITTVAAMTISSASIAEQQILHITPAEQQVQGSQVQLQVSYDTSDAKTTSGLGLRVHYNAKQLRFNRVSAMLQEGLQPIGQTHPDTADYDNDPTTDTYLVVAWLDLSGNWPSNTLPAPLFQISFNITPTFSGRTAVNLSASSTSAGYTLQTNPAWVE